MKQSECDHLKAQIKSLKQEIEQLKKDRELYEEMFFNSLDLICIADLNTASFVKINPAFSTVLGYTENEFLSCSFFEFVHPEDVESTRTIVDQSLKRGEKVMSFTNRYRHVDGSYRWLDWTSHPIPEKGITFAVAHDITRLKEMEDSLRKNEVFIRTVMDNLPLGIAVNTIDQFEYVNDNFPRLYRASKEAILDPEGFWDAVYEDPVFREKIKNQVVEGCASGDPEKMVWEDVPITRKGEKTTYVTARNIPIPEKGMMISTVWDVTKQKKTERALTKTKLLLEETQALARLGGWSYEFETRRFMWTDEVFRIHGIDPIKNPVEFEHVIGFYDPESAELLREAFTNMVEQHKPYDLEVKLKRTDGRTIWVRTMGQPVIEDGRVIRATGNISDITDRKTADHEREKLQIQLSQAQKMEAIGTLAGGVAHDFNNMLSIILGNTEMILDDLELDSPEVTRLKQIKNAAERSGNLTRQLLAFARKQTISPQKLDLNESIESMLKMLSRLIGENIDLAWRPWNQLWPIKIDPSQIDQILANLCVNSRDAIKDVGKITIETDNMVFDEEYCRIHKGFKPGDFIMVAVSDNGCGIEKQTMENLFDPFFTTKALGKGTGLGLSTVYGIVKQNEGFINVYSEVGRGTTIKIYFPRYSAEMPSLQEPKPVKKLQGGSETILVVEDEPAILEMTKMMLRRIGYAVLEASDPNEAIGIGKGYQGKIDLLLTDVIMPKMNGRILAEEMMRIFPEIKCLYMSGYTANVIAHHGVLDQGMQFIEKPFSKEGLAIKIRQVLAE